MGGRKAPPSQYLFKIQSFSSLSKASVETVASDVFEAGDHKWSLSIYPAGNKKRGGQDHVSIYLVLVDQSPLPTGWEVNAIVNFSVYNSLEDEYIITQDASVRRYHALKTEWGIAKFIDLDTFNDPSNGYLIDNTCVFGVEVFIVKTTDKEDCLSAIHEPTTLSYTWKFDNFSSADQDRPHNSEPFVAGNYKWNILLYPNGCGEGKGNSISAFLVLSISTLQPNTKLLVDYTVRAKDQIGGQHAEKKGCRIFSNSSSAWGFRELVSLVKFKDPKSGFLVGDTCYIEVEFKVLGLIKPVN